MSIWKKLKLGDQAKIAVLGAPESFAPELDALEGVRVVTTASRARSLTFALVFALASADVDRAASLATRMAAGDVVLWIAYPKKTSKRYTCTFDRDHGWEPLGHAGFEPVSLVAIDEDWSALRFRRVDYIRTLTRDPARRLTKAGKARGRESRG